MFHPTAADLEKLKAEHPLPEKVEDVVLAQGELADFFDKTENTITSWRKGGMPVLTEGGNGRPYEYQLSDCFAWYQGWLADKRRVEAKKQESRNQFRLALFGDGVLEEGGQFLSTKDQTAEYEAAVAYMKAAEMRNSLVRVADVQMTMTALLGMVRGFILNLPDEIEREFGTDAETTSRIVDKCNGFLSAFKIKIEESNLVVDPERQADAAE